MLGWRRKTRPAGAARLACDSSPVEPLEPRRLLSATGQSWAAANGTVEPQIDVLDPAAFAPAAIGGVQGFTPRQIRQAYGFDDATFSSGTIAGDGRGQTIAVIDAFHDP